MESLEVFYYHSKFWPGQTKKRILFIGVTQKPRLKNASSQPQQSHKSGKGMEWIGTVFLKFNQEITRAT